MINYQINVTGKAEKEYLKLPKKIQERVDRALATLTLNPKIGKTLTGKFNDCFSLRVWPYRVIYAIDLINKVVVILRIAHRKEVYR